MSPDERAQLMTTFTDKELKDELYRREQGRLQADFDGRHGQFIILQKVLDTHGAIVLDALAPKHEGSSCSDQVPMSGYYSDRSFGRACKRCSLIDLMNKQITPEDAAEICRFEIFFSHDVKNPDPPGKRKA